MGAKRSIFYNALMLTGVNLLLRLVSTSFQVFISGRLGAEGVGLLQLVMSVASLAMTAGMAGVRTSSMYLTAEELGKKRRNSIAWILSGCTAYSLAFGLLAGVGVFALAPWIARVWIADLRIVGALRLFAVFLPVSCLGGVMCGYFTADNRIGALAAVEVGEQLLSMAATACALRFWAGADVGRACQAVVLGGCAGSCLTLVTLMLLRISQREKAGPRIPVARRLARIALPLAIADDMKVGISTVENLMVPRRLARYCGAQNALAQFGTVCGMVFPVLMFPAAILYGLADLLIPEMARCNAAGSLRRIRYLARRSLRLALFYGVACGGCMLVLAQPICGRLYDSQEAAQYLRWFAWLTPMLYSDAVVDALNKGLGKQRTCVRINILTSVMDVVGLYFLLPHYGVRGYFASFVISHAVNAALSVGLLLKTTGAHIALRVPVMTGLTMIFAVLVAGFAGNVLLKAVCFLAVCFSGLYLSGILYAEDLHWALSLAGFGKKKEKI